MSILQKTRDEPILQPAREDGARLWLGLAVRKHNLYAANGGLDTRTRFGGGVLQAPVISIKGE